MRKTLLKTAFCALFAVLSAEAATPLAQAQSAEDASLLKSAQAAFDRGEYASAEKIIAALKGADAQKAKLLQAQIELCTGRYEKAVETAKAAARLSKEARISAAPIAAEALQNMGKVDEAIAALKDVETEKTAYRARLLLGEILVRMGKRNEAGPHLRSLFDAYEADEIKSGDAEGLSLVGRAAHLLRSYKNANNVYNEAERAGAKNRVETLLWRSELFLEKYDPGHAGQVVSEALKIAPSHPLVHVAMARVKLENAMDFEAAQSEIRKALAVNPNLWSAFFVQAGLALRDLDIEAADAAADKGLKINPNQLELLSMKAAIRYLADDAAGFERYKKTVFKLNPEYSQFYQIVCEYAEWEHRYEEIVKMMQEAVKIDPADAKAYAVLGLNLIRSGDEKGGLDALEKAWEKDKFNVRVFNTLNLYEKQIANEYVSIAGQQFVLRYHKDEKDILERYAPRMLEEAWTSMVKRYGFTPKMPVSIEFYADTEHFSVRTSGLPNVGIQGVCFGQTLAALSPLAGQFNWGNILWHELGHVFAIQMSKNHVPRWFTEGLSEYETIIRRPEWQREEDPALFAALKGGRIPAVNSFNRAFTHVDSVEDVTMAYYAASQIVVFMAKEFGFPKVVSMMPLWAAGKRTPEVVKEALGITAEELDRRYRAWLEPHLDRYNKQYVPDLHAPPLDIARKAAQDDPKNAKKLVQLAFALMRDDQNAEGEAVLSEALKADPKQPDAHYYKLVKAMRTKKFAEAQKLVDKMVADGHDGYAIRMKAADLAELNKDEAKARAHFEAASKFDPSQAEPLQGLYDLANRKKDKAGQLSALRRLALVDQHDRRVWIKLLRLLVERGEWEEARKFGEGAIFVDVANPEVHRLYARALARTGHFHSAIFELNSALIALRKGKPKPDETRAIYRELSAAYTKLKRDDLAKKAQDYEKLIAPSDASKPADAPGGPRPRKDPHDQGGGDEESL